MNTPERLPAPSPLGSHWRLDPGVVFLNHGSFGACPQDVLVERERLLRLIEADPMDFLLQRHQPLLRKVTARLEVFTGAQPGSIVMVENASTGVNTVLRNLTVGRGDRILVTDQEYFSSGNALRTLAEEKGLEVVQVDIPWPADPESFLGVLDEASVPGVRYALLDHVVSSSGIVLPLKRAVDLLASKGIGTVVDGAHGPGQLPLDLGRLGCMAYTGNCHKWLCSPRSSALLYVRPDFQKDFKPLVISHLPGEVDSGLSDFQLFFAWNGTPDPTPALTVPAAMDFMDGLLPGGWEQVMQENHALAVKAREGICSALGLEPPCPVSMVGSMAAITLEDSAPEAGRSLHWTDPLQRELRREYGIVVPITRIRDSVRLLRVSAQLYNSIEQFDYLADALRKLLHR